MSRVILRADSREYISYPLLDEDTDPSAGTCAFAFMALDSSGNASAPSSGDYVAGTWVQLDPDPLDGTADNLEWHARILMGPSGSKVLAAGVYRTYLKVTLSPEAVVRDLGLLQVV